MLWRDSQSYREHHGAETSAERPQVSEAFQRASDRVPGGSRELQGAPKCSRVLQGALGGS
eukprot:15477730-Alexandrium_andersonii.AAC.1